MLHQCANLLFWAHGCLIMRVLVLPAVIYQVSFLSNIFGFPVRVAVLWICSVVRSHSVMACPFDSCNISAASECCQLGTFEQQQCRLFEQAACRHA